MLERSVMVSRAAAGTDLAQVFAIIRAAHGHNAAAGITGGLVFLDGWFAQALEGPPAALEATLARIARDPRHGQVVVRRRERGLCRLFPGQALALRSRSCLEAELLEAFGYRPGFPVGDFPADVLVEFLVRACGPGRGARVRVGRGRIDPVEHPGY